MTRTLITILFISILALTGCAPVSTSRQPSSTATQPAPTLTTTATAEALAPAQAPATPLPVRADTVSYPIVDTGQGQCYDNSKEIACSQTIFSGQDAQYTGSAPSYSLSADGLTVQDQVTGLIWQRSPDTNGDNTLTKSDKRSYTQAAARSAELNAANFGGYSDWRLPTIKELYSLIDFRGTDPSGSGTAELIPFINTAYFQFAYGSEGERTIDSQYASSTLYVSQSSHGGEQLFGVNFADGRIKGYELAMPGSETGKTFFVICVRGNTQYGQNAFSDNGDQTITDNATSLTWAKSDSGSAMYWQDALTWVETQNAANYLGHNDWRLPNIKELQSILDYSRSPDTTNSAAIDPLFNSTQITNEAGQADYPYYWSGTTHTGSNGRGEAADYMAFGRALGFMDNNWVDVHGAGAQRSDPKSGDASVFSQGRGPQGDAIHIANYVRLVRGGNVTATPNGNPTDTRPSMTVEVTAMNSNSQGGPGSGNSQQTGPQTPPTEAINACSASSEGAACSFSASSRSITGTCKTVQQVLACVPANQPKP